MAKVKHKGLSSNALMMVVTGCFFVVLGLTGVLPVSEGLFSLNRGRTTLEIVFGVLEILCGIFILVDAFKRFPAKTSRNVLLAIIALWIIRIIITQILQGIELSDRGVLFQPNFWSWLFTLSMYAVVSVNLWILYRGE